MKAGDIIERDGKKFEAVPLAKKRDACEDCYFLDVDPCPAKCWDLETGVDFKFKEIT